MKDRFGSFSQVSSRILGQPVAFFIGCFTVFLWVVTGPFFHYSDTWQLVMNSYTSIVTFLMVFLLQNSQNRDAKITFLKLNELLRTEKRSRKIILEAEELSDEELDQVISEIEKLKRKTVKQEKVSEKVLN